MTTAKVAIIGSGNIGTDLMFKVRRLSTILEVAVFVGVDPSSDGLSRAQRLGIRRHTTGSRVSSPCRSSARSRTS
jgi:acetaldehyde dehydrogenase